MKSLLAVGSLCDLHLIICKDQNPPFKPVGKSFLVGFFFCLVFVILKEFFFSIVIRAY